MTHWDVAMLIDSHCHIFTKRIVQNMRDRPEMVKALKLNVHNAAPRLEPKALQESAEANGMDLCVLLPTAPPDKVGSVNDRFMGFTVQFPRLRTLATLHPFMRGVSREIERVFDNEIIGFKFSSFSQRFDLISPEATSMLTELEQLGRKRGTPAALVFDTFAEGHGYFGADPDHITTPSKLKGLVQRYPGINFIAAHMGGLLADFDELRRSMVPAVNLYLDTSNAAHTLEEDLFVELLQMHGPSHILFGTDWPWFTHEFEVPKIEMLLTKAGYDTEARAAVFGENARALLGLRR